MVTLLTKRKEMKLMQLIQQIPAIQMMLQELLKYKKTSDGDENVLSEKSGELKPKKEESYSIDEFEKEYKSD